MNLFWKKIFGKLYSTSKFEEIEREAIEAMKRYDEVEKSVELAEYNSLFQVVKSAKFIENKKILQNRTYKDTEEYRDWRKVEKLEKDPNLKAYFEVLNLEDLKLFLSFKKTPEYVQLGDPKAVEASPRLKKFKAFERSDEYKNYNRFNESYIVKEYQELKTKVSTPEFKKANDFWSDPKRWYSTPEYDQEQRFYQLQKNDDIVFYLKEKPERFRHYRSLRKTFSAEFDRSTIDKSQWQFGFHYQSPELKQKHSFANEKQAYTFGKNTIVEDGLLKIITKNEKVKASAWDTKRGFVEKDFEYTSDVLQTGNEFRQEKGMFQAKIRTSGNIHHAFWLGADKKLPHVNIFHFDGAYINVGNANADIMDGTQIKGINPSTPYVYSLIWTKNELVWKINNLEVYRTTSKIPTESLYMGLNSFITDAQRGGTGSMEIDWIRVYGA